MVGTDEQTKKCDLIILQKLQSQKNNAKNIFCRWRLCKETVQCYLQKSVFVLCSEKFVR